MGKYFYPVFVLAVLLAFLAGGPACYAADDKLELDWDYLTPMKANRDLNTVSLHVLQKISEKDGRTVYRGITITHPKGSIDYLQQNQASTATGIGPVYLVRNERELSGKLSAAFDMSGGFIVYDKIFPAGGRYYNFMWRAGPQFVYKFNENTSLNVGYTFMHVSNGGYHGHNPSYNAHGITLGVTGKF